MIDEATYVFICVTVLLVGVMLTYTFFGVAVGNCLSLGCLVGNLVGYVVWGRHA